MFKVITVLLVSLSAITGMAKGKALPKRTVTEKSQYQSTTSVETSQSSGRSTASFSPREIFEGNNKSELFLSFSDASIEFGGGGSNIAINGMYTYLVNEQVQVGGEIGLGTISTNGGSDSTSTIYGVGMYNFSPEISESFFAFGALGMGTVAGPLGGSSSKFGFKVGAGKRFPLMAKLNYVPMVWLEKVGEADPTVTLKPVNFSLIF